MKTEKNAGTEQSLETRIGLYWLNRLGIASLVFGIVFMLLYSFHFLGPWLKLALAFAVSAALIVLGEVVERKPDWQWFANGLTSGGWSLAYFTVYAAHYVDSVRVITSLPLETVLLIGVGAASLLSALRMNSQLMAILSISLAAGSILITGPSLLADVSFLVIAACASILGNRKKWFHLFGWSLAACYIGHFYCASHASTDGSRLLATEYLVTMWGMFAIAIGYLNGAEEKIRSMITWTSCINGAVFAAAVPLFSTDQHTSELVLGLAGSAYLAMARWLNKRQNGQLATVHSLIGLSLLNAVKAMRFSGVPLLAVDIMEIVLLAIIGLGFDIKAFRWFAVALTALFFPIWCGSAVWHESAITFGIRAFDYVILGLIATVVFAGLDALHHRVTQQPEGKMAYEHFYRGAANLIGSLCVLHFVGSSWQALGLFALGIINGVLAFRRDDSHHYVIGFGFMLWALPAALACINEWQTLPICLCVTALYAGYAWVREFHGQLTNESIQAMRWMYGIGGHVLLTLLVLFKVPEGLVSIGLGVEALALLTCGFFTHDRSLRISALAVLSILTGKLLFVDLAKFDTLERIVTFVVVGLIFLASSFVYGKFNSIFGAANDDIQVELQEPAARDC